ncbi:hypothetical protein MmiAt1_12760 [Methanimicrococcus sp. At1]|uniref:Insecticide toxin TcdB middle/N-terminal domain-containing protein n=1 Tax=Methanimicrococcus hacksteinii TaxID=3028293 RepID=A0ABU3VQK2_9EURY|nr:RHS repeat-associated core domain-containing protein [Methanimicrococcus sp. At1]MDV0445682.1 hypothetical protein [Methanimicrococcus sp. At1]
MNVRSMVTVCLCFMILFSFIPLSFAEEGSIDIYTSESVNYENNSLDEISSEFDDKDSTSEYLEQNEQDKVHDVNEFNNLNAISSSIPSIDVAKLTSISGPDFSHTSDAYLTSLFSGAATYGYQFNVPDGVASFQPSLSLSYNSHDAGGVYGWVGDGWSLNENYIQRITNSTLTNLTDDTYRLIFNGNSYKLIYNPEDGLYHTEVESYTYIKKENNGSNQKGEYWVVKTNDGAEYRFGYFNNSELVNPVSGRNYTVRWYLDQSKDVNNNIIHYNYSRNPTSGEYSAVYLNTITYNNGSAVIQFLRAPKSQYFDIYHEGCRYKEMNLLSNISMYVNSQLVRRYSLSYSSNDSRLLLSNISVFGSDNSSSLPPTQFSYNTAGGFTSNTSNRLPTAMYENYSSLGVMLVDLNGDGRIDTTQNTLNPNANNTWIKNGNAILNETWKLPVQILNNTKDTGVRFVDINGDGLIDIVQNSLNPAFNRTWINTGEGFELNTSWRIPTPIINNSTDLGVNFVDINGDGLVDIVQNTITPTANNTWINTGSGFVLNNSWRIPTATLNKSNDTGVRFVDLNGDGLTDIIRNSVSPTYNNSWINTGSGFVLDSNWKSPVPFVNKSVDQGVRLIDLNGDGLIDITQNSLYPTYNRTWINKGYGFVADNTKNVPLVFTNNGVNLGVVATDVTGDGLIDFVQNTKSPNVNVSYIKKANGPYLLNSIKHSSGSTTNVSYVSSTSYNNTNSDGKPGLPINMWLVSSILTSDGKTDGIGYHRSNYSYSGGLYNFKPYGESEFRGFGYVKVTTDRSIEHHYFHQDTAKKGLEYETRITTPTGLIQSTNIISTYDEYENNGAFEVMLQSVQTELSYTNSSPIVMRTNYTYDNFGNVIEVYDIGDISIIGDEKRTLNEYVYNTNKWILSSLKSISIVDSSNNELAKSFFFYDNHTSINSTPLKGELTKVINWNDRGNDVEISFVYDSYGNLIRQTDAEGNSMFAEYTNSTNYLYPENITNALGQKIKLNYDLRLGKLTKVTDANNYSTENVYDCFGRIIKVVKPYDTLLNPSAEYTYYLDGNIPESVKISLKENETSRLDSYQYYDGVGRITKVETPDGNGSFITQETIYNVHGEIKNMTAPYGVNERKLITQYEYDELGRITKITNPDFTTRRTVYDQLNITEYDEKGHMKKYVQDIRGNIIKVIEYNGEEIYETNYEYDILNRLTKIIPLQSYDQSNISFSNEIFDSYYLLDNRVGLLQLDYLAPNESVTYSITTNGIHGQNRNLFDFYDNFATDKNWIREGTGQFSWILESNNFIDNTGLEQESLNSNLNQFTSLDLVNLSEGYVYYTRVDAYDLAPENIYGMGIAKDDSGNNLFGFNLSEVTNYMYMIFDPKMTYWYMNESSALDYPYTHYMVLYKIIYDADEQKSYFYCDGNLMYTFEETVPINDLVPLYHKKGGSAGVTLVDYIVGYQNPVNVNKSQVVSNGQIFLTIRNDGDEPLRYSNVEFDISAFNFSNVSLSDQMLNIEKANSSQPNVISYTAPYKVANTTFVYDSLNNKVEMDDPDIGFWSYVYDYNGNLIKQTDSRDVETNFEYDALNRLTKVIYESDDNITYYYDNGTVGPLSKVVTGISEKEYSYDERMRILNETISIDNVSYTTRFEYNSLDLIQNVTYPNGQIKSMDYDNRGMLKAIPGIIDNIEYDSSNLIKEKTYSNGVSTKMEYDSLTKRLKNLQSTGNNSAVLQNLTYEFDLKGNVAAIKDYENNETQRFVYDDLDRLIAANSNSYSQGFVYNPLGSILAFNDGFSTTIFEYGENAGIHAPTKVNNASLYYDENGNLIEDGAFIYIYDNANNLKEVLKKADNETIAEYWYDENGARIKKVEAGKTTYYVNDVYNVHDGNASIYYYANGERIAKESADGIVWYLNDYLGSTNVAVNENGSLDEMIHYYPFGNHRSVSGGSSSHEISVENLFKQDIVTLESISTSTVEILNSGLKEEKKNLSSSQFESDSDFSNLERTATEFNLYDSEFPDMVNKFTDEIIYSTQWDFKAKNNNLLSSSENTVYNESDLIEGHKYYIRTQIQNGSALSNDIPIRMYSEKATDRTISSVFEYGPEIKNMEYLLGSYNPFVSSMDLSNPVLVDLTKTFGSGQEPDVGWCNEYLSNVSGSEILTVPLLSSSDGPQPLSSTYTYTGKEYDSEVGIYYFGARYYNPSTFVFTQADNMIPDVYNPQALNRYSFCLNNPVTYTDPDGHAINIGLAIGGVIAGAVFGAVSSALIQHYTTGTINKNEVLKSAAIGAVVGGIGGLTMGVGLAAATAGTTKAAGLTMFGTTAADKAAAVIVYAHVGGYSGIVSGSSKRALEGEQVLNGNEMVKDIAFGSVDGVFQIKNITTSFSYTYDVSQAYSSSVVIQSSSSSSGGSSKAVIKDPSPTKSSSSSGSSSKSIVSTITTGAKSVQSSIKSSVNNAASKVNNAINNFKSKLGL